MRTINIGVWLVLCVASSYAQTVLTADEAVAYALRNNGWVRSAQLHIKEAEALKRTATEIAPLTAMWMSGQYNSLRTDNNFTFTQTLPLPGTMMAKARLGAEQVRGAEYERSVVRQNIAYEVRDAVDEWLFLKALRQLRLRQDTLMRETARASAARYRSGEAALLEQMTAEAKAMESANLLRQSGSDVLIQESRLRALLRIEGPITVSGTFGRLDGATAVDTAAVGSNPTVMLAQQQWNISRQNARVERRGLLPEITLGYFNQSLIGYQKIDGAEKFFGSDKRFTGFQAGLALPLWARPQLSRIRAASLNAQAKQEQAGQVRHQLREELEAAWQENNKARTALEYYEQAANRQAELLMRQTLTAYRKGELSFTGYLQSMQSALEIQTGYLHALRSYNRSLLKIRYLTGQFAD